VTNVKTILDSAEAAPGARTSVYVDAFAAWAAALALAWRGLLRDRRDERAALAQGDRELAAA
jgi:hypothetical protein